MLFRDAVLHGECIGHPVVTMSDLGRHDLSVVTFLTGIVAKGTRVNAADLNISFKILRGDEFAPNQILTLHYLAFWETEVDST